MSAFAGDLAAQQQQQQQQQQGDDDANEMAERFVKTPALALLEADADCSGFSCVLWDGTGQAASAAWRDGFEGGGVPPPSRFLALKQVAAAGVEECSGGGGGHAARVL